MNKNRLITIPSLVTYWVLLAVMVASCTPTASTPAELQIATEVGATSTPAPKAEKVLYMAVADESPINPSAQTWLSGTNIFRVIYDQPVGIGKNGDLIPSLVEKWEISPDARDYTFYLQKGVTFCDGTPFNAEAFKWNLDRYTNVSTAGQGLWKSFADKDSVKIVDEYTIQIHFEKPFATFLLDLSTQGYSVQSPSYIKSHSSTDDPEAMEWMMDHACGTGPFILEDWIHDDRVIMVKNPNYWGGNPSSTRQMPTLDRVVIRIIPDADVARLEIESGNVDIWENPPREMLDGLRENPNLNIVVVPFPKIAYITYDVSKPPFDDIKVRQAVAHAINYDELIQVAEAGLAPPLCGMIPVGLDPNLPFDKTLCLYDYDLTKAKELMAQSKSPNGFTVNLMFAPGRFESFPVAAELIQAYLKEIGITANLVSLEVGAQVAQMAPGQYGLSMMAWNAGKPDPDEFVGWFFDQYRVPKVEDSWVAAWWDNQEALNLVRNAPSQVDPEKRSEMYDKANRIAMEEAAYLPLYQGSRIFVLQKNVLNFDYSFVDLWNFWLVDKK